MTPRIIGQPLLPRLEVPTTGGASVFPFAELDRALARSVWPDGYGLVCEVLEDGSPGDMHHTSANSGYGLIPRHHYTLERLHFVAPAYTTLEVAA